MPHLSHVGTYARVVSASLARVWENVFDWEHLPHLHATSFAACELLDRGDDFWRARVETLRPRATAVIELRADRACGTYVTRTVSGTSVGSEIRTTLAAAGERRTRVEVEFHVAGMARLAGPLVGRYYTTLYRQLWDEDEAMMIERQAFLDARAARSLDRASRVPIRLGRLDELRRRVPCVVEAFGERVRLVEIAGSIHAHVATCPHLGGPLAEAKVEGGTVTCPWHGYAFDVRSGEPRGAHKCRLPRAPSVQVDDATGEATLVSTRV